MLIKFTVGVLCLFLASAVQAAEHNTYTHEQYDTLVNPMLRLHTESMGAFMDAMKSYIIYTTAQNIPGAVESGVGYYYDNDAKRMERTLFYRIGAGYPRQTNKPLDCKIDGTGFFVVMLPGGWPAYTRDGRMRLDENNRLVMFAYPFPIMGESGPIYLPSEDITINEQGVIEHRGEFIDVLRIVAVKSRFDLKSYNQSIFHFTKEDHDSGLKFSEPKYTIRQGYVEDSSVTKGYIGLVPEWKNGHEAQVKSVKTYLKSMTAAIQQANPQ